MKDDTLTIRVNTKIKREFQAVADIRGLRISQLINQFMVSAIREEKQKDLGGFQEAIQTLEKSAAEINKHVEKIEDIIKNPLKINRGDLQSKHRDRKESKIKTG